MSVRFVAIIDRKNEPCYFKACEGTDQNLNINYQFLADMALDFMDDPNQPQSGTTTTTNLVDQLFTHDGVIVYGLQNNTNMKIIVGVNGSLIKDRITQIIHAISRKFVEYQMNPFKQSSKVQSPQFDAAIENIIRV